MLVVGWIVAVESFVARVMASAAAGPRRRSLPFSSSIDIMFSGLTFELVRSDPSATAAAYERRVRGPLLGSMVEGR